MPNYLEREDILEAKTTAIPRGGINADGYGSRIPTRYMVRLKSTDRWHRVYVVCYSNSGTCYVRIRGEMVIASRVDHDIQEMAGER